MVLLLNAVQLHESCLLPSTALSGNMFEHFGTLGLIRLLLWLDEKFCCSYFPNKLFITKGIEEISPLKIIDIAFFPSWFYFFMQFATGGRDWSCILQMLIWYFFKYLRFAYSINWGSVVTSCESFLEKKFSISIRFQNCFIP